MGSILDEPESAPLSPPFRTAALPLRGKSVRRRFVVEFLIKDGPSTMDASTLRTAMDASSYLPADIADIQVQEVELFDSGDQTYYGPMEDAEKLFIGSMLGVDADSVVSMHSGLDFWEDLAMYMYNRTMMHDIKEPSNAMARGIGRLLGYLP
jgi:hypothetical protein